jgi:hypothetical protein
MKEQITWLTVDGKVFDNKAEALAHERSLPRVTRYILEKGLSEEDLAKKGLWQFRYTEGTYTTNYECPSFLRTGTTYESHDVPMFYYSGTLQAALEYAVEDQLWWSKEGKYFRSIEVING